MCKDGDETLFCVRILPQSLYDLTVALLCSVQLASLSGDLQISELQQWHGRPENFLAADWKIISVWNIRLIGTKSTIQTNDWDGKKVGPIIQSWQSWLADIVCVTARLYVLLVGVSPTWQSWWRDSVTSQLSRDTAWRDEWLEKLKISAAACAQSQDNL